MYVTVAPQGKACTSPSPRRKRLYVTVIGHSFGTHDINTREPEDTGSETGPQQKEQHMSEKTIPRPDRIRHIPSGFGWVDHRFVREGHVRLLSRESLVLYLFLVTVADENGISWYSDEKLCFLTGLTAQEVASARRQLAESSLASYSRPVYQVLELPRAGGRSPAATHAAPKDTMMSPCAGGLSSISDILASLAKGGTR